MDSGKISRTDAFRQALAAVAAEIGHSGDKTHADKLAELGRKLEEERTTVAFCGHFSAGKSTLVNRLCGAALLPSSPIPTSANVVSIRGGEAAEAVIRRVAADGRVETAAVPPEELEAFCVNGDEILSVDIRYPSPLLGDRLVLLDTPGIDSTDNAHRLATESALHLADAVFYVMDYNHVQSEINFTFAKRLKDWGKPLYLIVNQIDKHRDSELAFEAYRHSVEQAFASWHLEPAGTLYLSLREPDHPRSEWAALLRLLDRLAAIREPLTEASVAASAAYVLGQHREWLENGAEEQRSALLAEAGGEERAATVLRELAELQRTVAERAEAPERLRSELRGEVQSLLDNAIIIPAATRELAGAMLDSHRPGFRVGLLFTGAKTAAEQEKRLNAFAADFNAQVKASIDWHVKDLLRKAAEKVGWRGEEAETYLAERLSPAFGPDWLLSHIRPGAVFGDEYKMTYSRDVAADAKAAYRRLAYEVIDELVRRSEAAARAAAAESETELEALREQAAAAAKLADMAAETEERMERLAGMLPAAPPLPPLPRVEAEERSEAGGRQGRPAAEASAPGLASAGTGSGDAGTGSGGAGTGSGEAAAGNGPQTQRADSEAPAALAPAATNASEAAAQRANALDGGALLAPQRLAAAKLRAAAGLLEPLAPLRQAASALLAKADRLERGRFTIALFGAFSAGKSSFANALLGESALPVSPNPTTAAINRIVPPSEGHPHGTARVMLKSRPEMLDDIAYSLSLLGEEADPSQPEAMLKAAELLRPENVHAGGRPHYSFLKAALAGWSRHEGQLGTELLVENDAYRAFVAEESRSCFVREIELSYDSPLTSQGIVLVDTPGADSVNARHTGVAFNYIKNADAVLFVTYYNHAFSQADRQFLLQLGSVKDQFELDKMFFVVNAADLAANEAELQGVLSHVEANLLQHGIRFPRLYPVSSLNALEAKRKDDGAALAASGMAAFESAFLHFAENELGALAVESAMGEAARAAALLRGWIEASERDAASRASELAELETKAAAAATAAERLAAEASGEPLRQELDELLHYVVQRIRFRFGDHFNLAFNPSALQDDGRDLRKMLWTCWLELQRLLGRELSQELLATSLRLEHAVHRLAGRHYEAASREVAGLLDGFAPATPDPQPIPTPGTEEEFPPVPLDAKWLWIRFKGPRPFFEGGGKAAMRAELEGALLPVIRESVDRTALTWRTLYDRYLLDAVAEATKLLKDEIGEYVAIRRASLELDADPERLKDVLHRLESLQ